MIRRKKVLSGIILLFTLMIISAGCTIDTEQNNQEDPAENLYKYRSEYIGDSSNTSGLVGSLPYGEFKKGIELSTADKPYGLKVIYNVNDADVNMTELKKEFFNNALIIFSLIENVDYIDFVISNQGSMQSDIHQYNRELIQASGISDLFSYSKDKETFNKFLNEKIYTAGYT